LEVFSTENKSTRLKWLLVALQVLLESGIF